MAVVAIKSHTVATIQIFRTPIVLHLLSIEPSHMIVIRRKHALDPILDIETIDVEAIDKLGLLSQSYQPTHFDVSCMISLHWFKAVVFVLFAEAGVHQDGCLANQLVSKVVKLLM